LDVSEESKALGYDEILSFPFKGTTCFFKTNKWLF